MAGIEELRARAMASMAASSSTPLNPSHNPIPPPPAPNSTQSKEEGEICASPSSSPSDGKKEKFDRSASTSVNATQREQSPVSLMNKHHENLKSVSGSSLVPNPLSKLDAVKNKMLFTKKDHHTNAEKARYKSQSLTWHATSVSDDNLVISFSDDNSESEHDDTTDEQKRQIEDHMNLVERFKKPVATSGQPLEVLPRVSNDKNGMPLNSMPTSRQSVLSIRKVQGVNSKGSGATLLSNEVQFQKQHPGAKFVSQQDKKNIGDVFSENKQCQSSQEILPWETDVNHQKIVSHGKRKISGVNGNVCDSEVTTFDKHLKSTSTKKTMKRLKTDEESHMKNKSTTDEPVKLPFSFQKSDSLNGNITSSKHCSKEGFVEQSDSQIDSVKGKNNKTILSSSSDLDGANKMKSIPLEEGVVHPQTILSSSDHSSRGIDSAKGKSNKTVLSSSSDLDGANKMKSIPLEEGVLHTMQNVKLPCLQGCQGMTSAGTSFNDEMLGQRVKQVCCSPGLNQSSEFQKKISCAEDTAVWNMISLPDNLEQWPHENLLSHTKLSSFPQQVDIEIGSMLKLEELLDKELQKAQELRRNCELEEINALQAYRKAQRALMDTNRKCSLLYSKREYISAKLRALMMEASNSMWSTSCSNNSENVLNLLKDLAGVNKNTCPSQSNHMKNEKPNLELVGYGSNVGTTIADVSSSFHQNVIGLALPELQPVDRTPHLNFANSYSGAAIPQHNLYASNDQQKYTLSSISEQSGFSFDEISKNKVAVNFESKRERENIQDYELEAELRSKLVARLGLKGVSGSSNKNKEATYVGSKVDSTVSDKIQAINIHNQMQHNLTNQSLPEEETNNLLGIEKVNGPDIGQIKGSVISLCDDSLLNTTQESNTIQIPISSLPCSVLHVASKHTKFILPESNISAEKTFNIDQYDSMLGSVDNVTEYKSILSKLMNMDSYMVHHAIDPFWPFCMFELRGKCNDEECLWQHLQQNHWNGKHGYGTFGSAYWVGPNLVKAGTQSSGSLLARSSWQYWQTSFCMYFCLPFPIERVLPPYAQILHDRGCHVDDDNNLKMLSLYLQSQDITGKYIFHGLTEPEQSLELALDLLNMKEKRIVGRKKSLFVLSRSLEENTNNIVLWVVYLHVYYRKEKDIGKDDMFHHAVQHNQGSYELWLMYINSRMHFDQRMNAYTNAISALSRREHTDNMDIDYSSSCILDLFLQMMDFLCMSGKVENAISLIHKLLVASIDENSDLCTFSEIFQSLVVSDRCILCICCIYIKLYRRLPEIVVQQHELVKDLPFGIEWPFIQLTDIEKNQAMELIKTALDKVNLDVVVLLDKQEHFEQTILRPAHFMAVSHVRFSMAVEGLNISADLLVKYLRKYPTCIELVMLSVYYGKILKNESTFEMFEWALNNWPKQAPGVQRLWNQYAEYVLSCKRFDIANDLLVRWFDYFCKVEDAPTKVEINSSLSVSTELPCLSLVKDGDHLDPEESTFGLLNLFLYFVLRMDTVKAQLAINEALKHAAPDYFKHCVREHAAFHFPDGIFSTHSVGTLGFVSSYVGDLRSSPIVQPLNRKIFRNIKKPRVWHLINNLVSPVSRDCTVLNSVLEDWYGQFLLPQEFDEPKDLVDFAEYLMEISPANHKLAISVHKAASKNFGQTGISSASILFWASSLLVNCFFQALPVAPEQAWVDAASLLNVQDVRGISERFHRQGLLVYPFSVKLWESYYNLSNIIGNTTLVAESAREKGIELG